MSDTLFHLFNPQSIALIGAKDDTGSVAATLLKNLSPPKAPFKLFLVNPKRKTIAQHACFPSILDVPEPVDLAIIVTPAPTVPKIVEECKAAKAKSIIIISAGFKEVGAEGKQREESLKKTIASTPIRIIGPNCLGVMNTHYHLNATFAADMALKGNIAFISQSGAMCTAVLDWSLQKQVGFSAFVSIGSMLDVDFADLMHYFENDSNTSAVVLYVESIGDAKKFLKAAYSLSKKKPVLMIKGGKTAAAAEACLSHTGSLAGSDAILETALESVGIRRVESIQDLFNGILLLKQPRLKGPNIAVITNAGGPGIIATDAIVLNGLTMAKLSENTISSLNKVLPSSWSKGNPIDVLGDAKAEAYKLAVEAADKDPNVDGLLVILTPQDMTEPTKTAYDLSTANLTKPLVTSWMGGVKLKESFKVLNNSKIPNFLYPDEAAEALGKQWLMTQAQKKGNLPSQKRHPRFNEAASYLEKVRSSNREVLTEKEAKDVIALYGIPTVTMAIAKTKEEAVTCAKKIGFPVVLKVDSETITHKTDIGGVKLNLQSEQDVADAFTEIQNNVIKGAGAHHFQGVSVQPMIKNTGSEIIIGSTTDSQFGPVLLFGSGGKFVEVYKDTALALPPLSKEEALKLIQKPKIYKLLQGYRDIKPIDMNKLADILLSFSQLLIDHPQIKECDINPLRVSSSDMIALDARIVLHPKNAEIPSPCLA